jgi:hypothetical protein
MLARQAGCPLSKPRTSGERPWVYFDAWKIVNFLRKNF